MAAHPYLSICAGVGGLDLGLREALPGARAVCYVKRELTAALVLGARMREGRLDEAPVWSDVRSFDGRPWRGKVAGVIGGYPCQPFSYAGARRGEADERHLWPHIERIVGECEPQWASSKTSRGTSPSATGTSSGQRLSLSASELRKRSLKLLMSERLISASAYSSSRRGHKRWATPNARDGDRNAPDLKSTQGGNLNRDAILWPTPNGRDYKGGYSPSALVRKNGISRMDLLPTQAMYWNSAGRSLQDQTTDPAGKLFSPSGRLSRLRLNPSFVEWLMGLPLGWTSLSLRDSSSLETP